MSNGLMINLITYPGVKIIRQLRNRFCQFVFLLLVCLMGTNTASAMRLFSLYHNESATLYLLQCSDAGTGQYISLNTKRHLLNNYGEMANLFMKNTSPGCQNILGVVPFDHRVIFIVKNSDHYAGHANIAFKSFVWKPIADSEDYQLVPVNVNSRSAAYLKSGFFQSIFAANPDAILLHFEQDDQDKVYAFYGDKYVQYNDAEAKNINENWPGLNKFVGGANDLTAVVNLGAGNLYFFKEQQVIKYSTKWHKVEANPAGTTGPYSVAEFFAPYHLKVKQLSDFFSKSFINSLIAAPAADHKQVHQTTLQWSDKSHATNKSGQRVVNNPVKTSSESWFTHVLEAVFHWPGKSHLTDAELSQLNSQAINSAIKTGAKPGLIDALKNPYVLFSLTLLILLIALMPKLFWIIYDRLNVSKRKVNYARTVSFSYGASQRSSADTPTVSPQAYQKQLMMKLHELIADIEAVCFIPLNHNPVSHAVEKARAYTRRRNVVEFVHSSSGIGANGYIDDSTILRFNDVNGLRNFFAKSGEDVAAVVIEPIKPAFQFSIATQGFMRALRECCDQYGSVLIINELNTGFRTTAHGVHSLYSIKADLMVLEPGVVAQNNAYPIAGHADIINAWHSKDEEYKAAECLGQAVLMQNTLETLEAIAVPELYSNLIAKTNYLCDRLSEMAFSLDVPMVVRHYRNMFSIRFYIPETFSSVHNRPQHDVDKYEKFLMYLKVGGIILVEEVSQVGFVDASISYKDIDFTIKVIKRFFKRYWS
jgi:glutamate-1-semialdehyde 2,1-aminomutase